MPSLSTATIKAASVPRIRGDNPKVKSIPIPDAQRKEKAAQSKKTQEEIDDAVQEWFDNTMAKAAELALRFGKKPRYFLDIFFAGGARMLTHQEKVNPHNAFVSLKAQELREDGQARSLLEIQREFKDEYDALGTEQRQVLTTEFKENIKTSKKLKRPSPRGRIQDFSNTVRNMILLINGLKARAGVEGFFCLVCNNASFHVQPRWFFTSEALADYMRIATANRWDAHEVGMKLEAFAIAGCDPINMFNTSKKKADYLKSEIRAKISSLLVEITGNPKAVMQYSRYEEDIVQRYGILLQGWTYENFVNPSELSSSLTPLTILLDALKSGDCKFVKLSAAEQTERETAYQAKIASGEVTLAKRKHRSDAGIPRKKAKVTGSANEVAGGRSASVVPSDDED